MTETDSPMAATTIRHRWRFAVVLLASLLLSIVQPLTTGLIDERGSFDVFFSLLIVAVLWLVFEQVEHRRTAIPLGVMAFVAIWLGAAVGGPGGRMLLVGAQLLAACLFALALYGILQAIFARQTSGDAMFGVVCGYLLLGIIWSLIYSALETASPGSFRLSSSAGDEAVPAQIDRSTLSYFSFITLATVGYGDVIPTTPLARSLAWIEAIAGQFYLAVLVAGLVGYKVTQASSHETQRGGR